MYLADSLPDRQQNQDFGGRSGAAVRRVHPAGGSVVALRARVVRLTAEDRAQPGQPIGRTPLGAVVAGHVVVPAGDLVRRVLLGDDAVGVVVRVAVALAVVDPARAGVVRVAQVRAAPGRPARP